MARITVEEVYGGEKYAVMSAVMADYLKNGRPVEYDPRPKKSVKSGAKLSRVTNFKPCVGGRLSPK